MEIVDLIFPLLFIHYLNLFGRSIIIVGEVQDDRQRILGALSSLFNGPKLEPVKRLSKPPKG